MALDIDLLAHMVALRVMGFSQQRMAERLKLERGEVCKLLRQIDELDSNSEEFDAVHNSATDDWLYTVYDFDFTESKCFRKR